MTPLHRLLLRACCSPDAAVSGESFHSWRTQVDPMTVEHASCDLFGILDHNLTRHGIPCAEHERWTGVRRRNWAHQTMIMGAFRPAMAGLVTRVGRAVLMDCAALMARLPEPSGWRLFQTPGVCVPRSKIGDALDVLGHAGWVRPNRGEPRGTVLETTSSLLLERSGYPRLRLHWRLFPFAELPDVEAWLSADASQAPGYPEGCMQPHPAALALSLFWQTMVLPPENSLIPCVDVARLVEAFGDDERWGEIPSIAVTTQTRDELGSRFHAVSHVAGVALPAGLKKIERDDPAPRQEMEISLMGRYRSAYREWRRFRALRPGSSIGFRTYAAHVRGLEVSLRNAIRRALRS